MSLPSLKAVLRTPSGGVAASLIASLLLVSVAGVNTVWLARAALLGCFAILIAYLFLSDQTSRMTRRERALTLACTAVLLIAIERVGAWAQPKPPSIREFPRPPLMLMIRPLEIRTFADTVMTPIPGQSMAVSYLRRPQGGYAGFGDNGGDDPMLGIADVDLLNLSDGPVTISWQIRVEGEGRSFTLKGDGRGRWQRQLNVNDTIADTSRKHGDGLAWLLSPVTLRPHERLAFEQLAFVAPGADAELKRLIVNGGIDEKYEVSLEFRNLAQSTSTSVRLPYGQPARKTYATAREWLEDVARQQGVALPETRAPQRPGQ